jgi:adenine-specific DNA-methyltransferase
VLNGKIGGVLKVKLKEFNCWINENIQSLTEDEFNIVFEVKEYFEKNKTHELSKKLFDKIHEKNKQKLLGITYTPNEIRQELTLTVMSELLKGKKIEEIEICDPCCGSGLFSLSLIDFFVSKGISIEQAVERNVFFYDIDRLSIAISLTNLYVYLQRNGVNPQGIKANCKVINYFDLDRKFDGFITNPPYVKLQNLTEVTREQLKNRYPDLFLGSIGLSSLFLKKMLDDLNQGGMVGVITQNNFFTSNSGKGLRTEIQKNVFKIDNFGSEPIFKDVTAYACLFYVSRSNCKYIQYRKINKGDDFSKSASKIETSTLDPSKWRLGTDDERSDLSTLESKGVPLGQACRIWVGIATQLDKAFNVFKEGGTWRGTSPDGLQFEIEKDIVKPLIRVADLTDDESLLTNNRGVIYPYEIVGKRAIAIAEDEMRHKFPKTIAFLQTWQHELLARDKGAILPANWYKWGRSQSMLPEKRKLLTKTFNQGPKFYLDESDSLFSNGYALIVKKEEYSLEFIREVLNSNVFFYYAKLTSFEIEGEYQCYQKNFIERFCLPDIDLSQQNEILAEKNIDEFLINYYKLNFKLD